jgi:hypothetical protein
MGTRNTRVVEKKIKALIDVPLTTYFETYYLVKDEVRTVKFKTIDTFESFVEAGVLIEADDWEKEEKIIPIIPTEVDEEGDLSFVGEDVEIPIEEQGGSNPDHPSSFDVAQNEDKI